MHIIARIEKLRHREHDATVDLIEALLECKRSGAHLSAGYPSIFTFLTHHLRYSKAAASRRWKAMKCAERHPEVLGMLREHRTNLSVLATIEATLAKASDPGSLLAEIDGQSSVEVERRVAARNPVRPRREQIRREFEVRQGASAADANADTGASAEAGASATAEVSATAGADANGGADSKADADGGAGADAKAGAAAGADADTTQPTNGAPGGADCAEPLDEPRVARERIRIAFSLDPADYEKLQEAMTILSRKIPAKLTLEATMQELLHFFLERKRPKPERPYKASRGRHIPKALRDMVMIRDRGRCQFAGAGGRVCQTRHNLQIDHIQPVAKGGRTELENLRILCANHNRHRVGVSERNRAIRNRTNRNQTPSGQVSRG